MPKRKTVSDQAESALVKQSAPAKRQKKGIDSKENVDTQSQSQSSKSKKAKESKSKTKLELKVDTKTKLSSLQIKKKLNKDGSTTLLNKEGSEGEGEEGENEIAAELTSGSESEISISGSDTDSDLDIGHEIDADTKELPKGIETEIAKIRDPADETESEESDSSSSSDSETESDEDVDTVAVDDSLSNHEKQKPVKRKPMSWSAFRTPFNPCHLLDPVKRIDIWKYIVLMLERRGYTCLRDRPDPSPIEQLSVTKIKGFLGMFHMHAIHPSREPVYVVLFSSSGDPALKQLTYPSRHILVVTDKTTGKARKAMKSLVNQRNYLQTLTNAKEGGEKEKEKEKDEEKDKQKEKEKEKETELSSSTTTTELKYSLHEVYMECHLSECFEFDLLKQRYLETTEISLATEEDRKKLADIFERDTSKYPLIPDNDPVVRYFGYRPGDVLKEKTLCTTAGFSYSFRTVVHGKEK
jgi:DNA-directed RNA polymerase subunit H (RpoH/RPB5)